MQKKSGSRKKKGGSRKKRWKQKKKGGCRKKKKVESRKKRVGSREKKVESREEKGEESREEKGEESRGENMFLSFYLDRWSVPRRALGKCEVLTLPTASGRSDQSHRLAPVSITPYTCHQNQREGWEGQRKTTHSRKGALTTARPLLVNACLTGETCAKNFADICYTASGSRAESQLHPTKRIITAK